MAEERAPDQVPFSLSFPPPTPILPSILKWHQTREERQSCPHLEEGGGGRGIVKAALIAQAITEEKRRWESSARERKGGGCFQEEFLPPEKRRGKITCSALMCQWCRRPQ